MTIELEFPVSPMSGEPCPFTIWVPRDEASTPEYQQAIAAAESRMTDLPPFACDGEVSAADTFLGQWL
ncbi:hypothetical protein [Tianweitania sp.]|uniref:hypothetical protein n=1 Tax=Tianweitania sp. TaxID=2021634 RepID=UPI00289A4223|nr:hypothetical protein [Tianweitania sp.]